MGEARPPKPPRSRRWWTTTPSSPAAPRATRTGSTRTRRGHHASGRRSRRHLAPDLRRQHPRQPPSRRRFGARRGGDGPGTSWQRQNDNVIPFGPLAATALLALPPGWVYLKVAGRRRPQGRAGGLSELPDLPGPRHGRPGSRDHRLRCRLDSGGPHRFWTSGTGWQQPTGADTSTSMFPKRCSVRPSRSSPPSPPRSSSR